MKFLFLYIQETQFTLCVHNIGQCKFDHYHLMEPNYYVSLRQLIGVHDTIKYSYSLKEHNEHVYYNN